MGWAIGAVGRVRGDRRRLEREAGVKELHERGDVALSVSVDREDGGATAGMKAGSILGEYPEGLVKDLRDGGSMLGNTAEGDEGEKPKKEFEEGCKSRQGQCSQRRRRRTAS